METKLLVKHVKSRLYVLHMLHIVHGTRAFRFDGSYERRAYCNHHCSTGYHCRLGGANPGSEAQIHKDSHNSHIPPSRSPHTPIKNMRKKIGKKREGQRGHKGKTLEMVDNPAHMVTHIVSTCGLCGRNLIDTSPEGYERRQVFDIPPITLEVTEHRAERKRCPCGHVTTASFPQNITAPVRYGINIQSLFCIFSAYEYMSYDRISELMEHLIGHRVNESTVYSPQKRLFEELEDFEEKSICHLRGSEVIHNDETGMSIEGKRRWLHIACTEELTHYAVDDKRGREATDRIGILPQFRGRATHDGWKPCFQYQCRHGLCNAHHLRELVFFEEEEKAPWAHPLKDLLLFAKASVESAKNGGKDCVAPELLEHIDSLYREILEGALTEMPAPARTGKRGRIKKTKQQNLIERLLRHEESVLACLHDFSIPFDNNRAYAARGIGKIIISRGRRTKKEFTQRAFSSDEGQQFRVP